MGAVAVVSAAAAMVVAAVSTDKGMVVTDVAVVGNVVESEGVTEVIRVSGTASDSTCGADVMGTGVSGAGAELSSIDSEALLGMALDMTVIVGWSSIISAPSDTDSPLALGHTAVVPSKMKNMPIKVFGYAFAP